jgi:hypothetical protein
VIPLNWGICISVVLGSLLLVMGLVFDAITVLSGGVVLWGVAWLFYLFAGRARNQR